MAIDIAPRCEMDNLRQGGELALLYDVFVSDETFHFDPHGKGALRLGQASVTVLSMTCCWTRLQRGHVNVRKSWPDALLGSITVNFIGEPQTVHCGPRSASAATLSPTLTSALAVVHEAMRSF